MYPVKGQYNSHKSNRFVGRRSPVISAKQGKNGVDRRANQFVNRASEDRLDSRHNLWQQALRIILTGLCLASLWFLFYSDTMRIKNINVSQNINIPEETVRGIIAEQLAKSRWLIFSQSNLLVFNSNELEATLKDNFQLYGVDINKNLVHTRLIVKLVEKDYSYIWQEGATFYYINQAGDIILSKTEPLKDYPLIVNNGPALKDGRSIKVEAKYLTYAQDLNRFIIANKKGLSARYYVYDGTVNCLKLQVTNGPMVYFSTDRPVTEQFKKLDNLRRTELKDGKLFNSQQYIDLRFGDRIFYR